MTLFSLGRLVVDQEDFKKSQPKSKEGSKKTKTEDADVIKKIKAKSDDGDCPFC